jgi:hypothetical protein
MKAVNSLTLSLSLALTLSSVALVSGAGQQEQKSRPPASGKACDGHDMGQMNKRGDEQMGFRQDKSTHHFRLSAEGGLVEVVANDANDVETRRQIRSHLSHIAEMFAAGNFNAPALIHDQTPPGVSVMQRLKAEIKYRYEETERGGRVRISSRNPEAIAAIYEFLRFQIKEHQTGDSPEVSMKS